MNNAAMLPIPWSAKLVSDEETERLDKRREEKLLEIAREGWAKTVDWLRDVPKN